MIVERKIAFEEIISVANCCHSVIEIGAGECYNLCRIQSPVRIGIEGFRQLIEDNKDRAYRNIVPLCLDLGKIQEVFVDKSIDCIIGIDIIEHFTMEEAITLIKRCEAISKKVCMFMIPVGNHPQMSDDRGYGNELNFHRSTWYPEDMEKLGYDVFFDANYYNPSLLSQGKELGCMYCRKDI